jgi:hypothetical protein
LVGTAVISTAGSVVVLASGVWQASDALSSVGIVHFSLANAFQVTSGTSCSGLLEEQEVSLYASCSAEIWYITITACLALSIGKDDIEWAITVTNTSASVGGGNCSSWARNTSGVLEVSV